jgi:outer membrane cobalamin receptor
MKKLLLVLLCCMFILLISKLNLKAQAVQEQAAQTQPVENIQNNEKKEDASESDKEKTTVFTIGEIVIKAKRIANIEKATTTTIVTAKDIETHGDRDMSDTLKLVPGLSVYQSGKGHMRFRMRGFDMPYVAMLLDGIPLGDVYESNFDISKIPVQNVSEIIINRGTSSVLYGSTGTVGSVNIITKKPTSLYAKTQAEYGLNGDYTINIAQGNVDGNFYYWLTSTLAKQAPFEVSKKLDKSERREWFDKFFGKEVTPTATGYINELGYNVNDTNTAASTYLNDTGEWPHQESHKYNISAKTGYTFFNGFETGITTDYTKATANRYCNSLRNTEEFMPTSSPSSNNQWQNNPTTLSMTSTAFNWRDQYSITTAPYLNFEKGDFSIKGNVFDTYSYEYLDGYADSEETTAINGWGGAHSAWINKSAGFNIFPSYKIFNWNKINSSILYRWDEHLERLKADSQFALKTPQSAYGDAAYNLAGYSWFDDKKLAGKQLTVALEDEISLERAINIPINISAGISYDAQTIDKFKKRAHISASSFGTTMDDQYIAKSDSTIWGKRDSFNPVVGLTYEPLKDFLMVRGSFSQKAKLPTMSQYANVYANSDDGLKPEKSYNTSTGIEFLFLQRTLSVRTDYFYSKFKDKLATVSNPSMPALKLYTNTKGEDHQGVEFITNGKFKDILAGIMDLDLGLTYTYLKVKNLDTRANSAINKGDTPITLNGTVSVPEHQFVADVRLDFFTKTSLTIFGEYSAGAKAYAMKSNPSSGDDFSTKNYKEVKLHDPLMFNVKISQKVMDKYEAYVLCRNIFDDYDMDPFNPGPGRQFFFGLSAEI